MQWLKQLRRFTFLGLIGLIMAACQAVPADRTPLPGNTQIPEPAETSEEKTSSNLIERFDLSKDLYIRLVQPGVYVITHSFPWPANSMIVEMGNSELVLVDTPYTPEATWEVLQWVENRFGERKITAINTGFHYDNLGGNSFLIEEGIPVYGSQATVELLEERGEEMRDLALSWLQDPQYQSYRETHEALVYTPPTKLFNLEEGLQLEFGDESVQVYYPGQSHSPDNVVVYFPGRKILFGTCMIIGWDAVGNTTDADLEAWPISIRDLARFEFDLLVPGHGDRLDPGLLDHTLSLLSEYQK